jgi:hypothetical protein
MGVPCEATPAATTSASPGSGSGRDEAASGGDCFEESTTWEPVDMPGTHGVTVADARACQELCTKTADCRHFTFWELGRLCHLEDAFASQQNTRLGFTSGPFKCWDQVDHSLYMRSGNSTILPKEFACIERGILYSPILGVPKYFRQFPRTEEGTLEAITACRQRCVSTQSCGHWTLNRHEHMCRLARQGANRLSADYFTLSGQSTCKAADVIIRAAVPNELETYGSRPAPATFVLLLVAASVLALGAWRWGGRRGGDCGGGGRLLREGSSSRVMPGLRSAAAPGPAYAAVHAAQGAEAE